jgi:hypothetical protein
MSTGSSGVPSDTTSGTAGGGSVWTLRRLGAAQLVVLLVQIVVGVTNTLWLDVPEDGNAWSTSTPMSLVTIHMVVGLALVVLAVWIQIKAARAGDAAWRLAGSIGIAGIVVGFAAGVIFLSTNGNDVWSLLMTVGCVVAIGGYAFGLTQGRPD